MVNRLRFAATVLAAACAGAQAAGSVVVFSDDFDANAPALNSTPSGWTVVSGTVDVIGAGSGFDWFGGAYGRYLDTDGSTGQGGTISLSLLLEAGKAYTLAFDLAGNQRGYGADTVQASLGTTSQSFTVEATDPFGTRTMAFSPSSTAWYTLSFTAQGGDNVGALLDNVQVSAAVPEPQAYALWALGLIALRVCRRGRRGA